MKIKKLLLALLVVAMPAAAIAVPRVLPQKQAAHLCRLLISDGGGTLCPMSIYARNLTTQLFGTPNYGDYTAEQVISGLIFFFDDWQQEPALLQADDHSRWLLTQLHSGQALRVFPHNAGEPFSLHPSSFIPHTSSFSPHPSSFSPQPSSFSPQPSAVVWYAPTDKLPSSVGEEHRKYISEVFTRLNGEVQTGQWATVDAYIARMIAYQCKYSSTTETRPIAYPLTTGALALFVIVALPLLFSLLPARPAKKNAKILLVFL